MPAVRTEKTEKAAKPAKTKADAKSGPKEKKPPTAYNIFMKDQLPLWKAEHPDSTHKEAFKAVAETWAEHDLNPNKGKPKTVRKPKAKKDPKEPKKANKSKKGSSSTEPSSSPPPVSSDD